jgi:Ca-activated chloride channel family protein
MNELLGLLTSNNQPVPLLGVTIKGDLLGRGAKITIQQKFRNDEKKAIEAVYKFPLPEGSAITGFKIWINDRIIEGMVEERETAFNKYDDAMMQGEGAYLIDEERPNIFTLSAGNINPGMEVIIEINLVMLMDNEGLRKHRLVLPTAIAPRYIPANMPDEKGIPVEEIIHPLYAPDVTYGMSLLLNIHHHGKLAAVESPSHPIRVNLQQDLTRVELSTDQVRMDHDFILLIDPGEKTVGQAWAFDDGHHTFYQLDVLIPNDESADAKSFRGEIIFVLDCSGSMQGESIRQAKKALEVSLKALSPGCSFNVYRFGSQYNSFFKKPEKYSEDSLASALHELQNTDADLGGTEIYQPLKDIYKASAAQNGRTIVLMTDGEVANEQEIFDLASANHSHTRVFPIGIGAGPNEHLIKGMARAGSGVAEFVYPGERLEPKVLRLFNLINNPRLEISHILWDDDCEQAPFSPGIFTDTVSTIFARTKSRQAKSGRIILKGKISEVSKEWSFAVQETEKSNMPLPQLWAREKIRDLEESPAMAGSKQSKRKPEKSRNTVIEISKTYGILSRFTSYLGIEKRSKKDKTSAEVELRKVPTLITTGWHGGRFAAPAAMPLSPKAVFAGIQRQSFPMEKTGMPTYYAEALTQKKAEHLAPKLDKTNILLILLSTQQAQGGFIIDEKIAILLGIDLKQITALADEIKFSLSVDHLKLVSTLLVFEIFETHYADEAKTWRAVTQKSRQWLDSILQQEMPAIGGRDAQTWVRDYVRNNIKNLNEIS